MDRAYSAATSAKDMLLYPLTNKNTASIIESTRPDWLDDVEHESWPSCAADKTKV